MKRYDLKIQLLSRAAVIFLIASLILSPAFPLAGITAYAETNESTISDEVGAQTSDSQREASKSDEAARPAEKAATTISGYKTSYNKRLKADLVIAAEVTPGEDREVQLQRYSSETDSWTTVLTVEEPVADATSEATADVSADVTTEETTDAATDETTVPAETVTSAETAEAVESATVVEPETENAYEIRDGVAHIRINVPKEERMKTSSTWRLYVPATETAKEAYSEKINVTTRNLETMSLSARNACVYRINSDGTGTMIYSKNSCTEVAQASTTKLMTAVVLMESGLLNTTTKISPHAASTPWGSGRLATGDVYNTKDLLYAMLLPSANDAATAIAERVGGSEGAFVGKMNAKAKEMGLTKTQFRNPHGLDADGHYTTALELAQLTAYAYTFPEIRDCWATQFKSIKSLVLKRRWNLWSTNAIFSYVKEFLGGKTGTETNAGCCFTGVYTCNGNTYVTVVLGSGYGFSRWSDTKKLHSYIQDYSASSY